MVSGYTTKATPGSAKKRHSCNMYKSLLLNVSKLVTYMAVVGSQQLIQYLIETGDLEQKIQMSVHDIR